MKNEQNLKSGLAIMMIGFAIGLMILIGAIYFFSQKPAVPPLNPDESAQKQTDSTGNTVAPSEQTAQQVDMTKSNNEEMSDIDAKLNALDTDSIEVDQSLHDQQIDVTSQ